MLRIVFGSLVILAGLLLGTWIVMAAQTLSDSFPPSKTLGQNMALLAVYAGGFLAAYVAGEVGTMLIRGGLAKRRLKT